MNRFAVRVAARPHTVSSYYKSYATIELLSRHALDAANR